jgi:hypothetical protein
MKLSNLLERLDLVRSAEREPHGLRMAVLGYLGAMLELEHINVTEYLLASKLADNAYSCRTEELRNAN